MGVKRSKGQFILISAVIIGLMLISTASTISKAQSRSFTHGSTIYDINLLKHEAAKADISLPEERESFRDVVDQLPSYTSTTEFWDRKSDGDYDCFNVTLKRPGDRIRLNCIS